MSQSHSQIASFNRNICNLLRDPYKRNEYRKVILPFTHRPLEEIEAEMKALECEIAELLEGL